MSLTFYAVTHEGLTVGTYADRDGAADVAHQYVDDYGGGSVVWYRDRDGGLHVVDTIRAGDRARPVDVTHGPAEAAWQEGYTAGERAFLHARYGGSVPDELPVDSGDLETVQGFRMGYNAALSDAFAMSEGDA